MFKRKKIATERLEDSLKGLTERVECLERERKSLDLEFTELYDKVSHQMSRMAKRHAAAEKANGFDPNTPPANSPTGSLDPISEQIHARRNRGFLAQ